MKIYFDNKPLFIVKDRLEVEAYLHRDNTMFIDDFDNHTVKTMIHEMAQPNIEAGVFIHPDVDAVLDAFKKKFTLIQAAGGFVYAAKSKKALFIFRRGKWDLPKGKLDEGESIETCAIREIKEETGIEGIKIVKPLIITYHTYHQDKEFILKESHWYLVKANKEEATHPQEDEGIDDCKWVAKDELEQYLTGSYALIRDVTEKALEAIG